MTSVIEAYGPEGDDVHDSDLSELHVAAGTGDLEEIARILTQDPDAIHVQTEKFQQTPLHKAAAKGQTAAIAALIAAGADVFFFFSFIFFGLI